MFVGSRGMDIHNHTFPCVNEGGGGVGAASMISRGGCCDLVIF